MPRPYRSSSVRNRPGVTIRPAAPDRQLIAAWAKRWGCGVGEAAVRLAVMGAEVGHLETATGRANQAFQWLVDGISYPDVVRRCRDRWGCSDDDAHRLISMVIDELRHAPAPIPELRRAQLLWHGSRQAIVEGFGSLAMGLAARRYGYRVVTGCDGILRDVLIGHDMPVPIAVVEPWRTSGGHRFW